MRLEVQLEPTSEQEEMRRAVREFCTREVTIERLLEWERLGSGVDARIAQAVAELGWIGLGLPVAKGGSGASLLDVAHLVEECARGLLPRPLLSRLRGALGLAWLAPESPQLAAVARGERSVTLALDEPDARSPAAWRTAAAPDGRSINGVKGYVVDAAAADLHLVGLGRAEGLSNEPRFALIDRGGPGVSIEPLLAFGNDPQAHVTYRDAPVLEWLDGGPGFADWQRRQVALALAEMVGGMAAAIDATLAWVKEREQFGQKIAIFQAVRHQVADMGIRFTSARHLAWQAISRLQSGSLGETDFESAVVWVGQSFKQICWTAHHLHGGAGFVVEHPLRFHSERAQSLCIRWTPEAPMLARIAATMLD